MWWTLAAVATIVPALVLLANATNQRPVGPWSADSRPASVPAQTAQPRPGPPVSPAVSPAVSPSTGAPADQPATRARPVGQSPAPAGGGPAGARTAGTRPAPFTQSFARQPGTRPLAPLPSPTAAHRVAVNLDGCDRNYGSRKQCVPWRFPPGPVQGCEWLAAHGFEPLPVVGTDRHGLDTNRDGLACGPGDR